LQLEKKKEEKKGRKKDRRKERKKEKRKEGRKERRKEKEKEERKEERKEKKKIEGNEVCEGREDRWTWMNGSRWMGIWVSTSGGRGTIENRMFLLGLERA
jgi:uncharacterized membrane protein YdbT with pleckstrin-like domain